jgi:hypothetical protein
MDRFEKEGLILAHKIHFLLARLGLTRLREVIRECLDAAQREQFFLAEKKYRSKYPPLSLDNQINLLKAVLQRDLSMQVDSVLGDFSLYISVRT